MKISEATEFLEEAFDVLNAKYFEGSLPRIMITIQSSKKTYAHFTPWESWREDGAGMNEINLSAEHLDRPAPFLVSSLMHEMVHYYNYINGIKDVSRGGVYHNRRFKEEAEARDLIISYDNRIGWSITEPSEALTAFVEEQGWSEVSLCRQDPYGLLGGGRGGANGTGKKKSNSRRYVCPLCGSIARATKDLEIACIPCGMVKMDLQEKAG